MPNVDVPVDAKLEQAAALLEERFDPRAIVLDLVVLKDASPIRSRMRPDPAFSGRSNRS